MQDRRQFLGRMLIPGVLAGAGYRSLLPGSDVGNPLDPPGDGVVTPPEPPPPSGLGSRAGGLQGVHDVTAHGAVGDGTADDTAAIQEALDDAAGGLLWFPPGDYLVAPLRVPGDTHLRLAREARLRMAPNTGTNRAILEGRGTDRILVEGGRFDGNAEEQCTRNDLVRFENGSGHCIRDVSMTNAARHGVFLRRCSDSTVEGCTIESYGDGHLGFGIVFFMGCESCVATHNSVHAGGKANSGIACDAGTTGSRAPEPTTGCVVRDNVVSGTGEGVIVEGSGECIVQGNRIRSVDIGVRVSKDQGGDASHDCVVKGNRIEDVREDGILIEAGHDHLITGNSVTGYGKDVTGIDVRAQQGVPISGVLLEGNVLTSLHHGITCRPYQASVSDIRVSNNLVLSCLVHGVLLNTREGDGGEVAGVLIEHNYIADSRSVGMNVGIRVEDHGPGVRGVIVGYNTIQSISQPMAGDRSHFRHTVHSRLNFPRPAESPSSAAGGDAANRAPADWIEITVDGERRYLPAYD